MGRDILFVQGGGASVHDAWDAALAGSLSRTLGAGYDVHYPLMPNEDDPAYDPWSAAIRRELMTLAGHPLLVAHSVGATIALNLVRQDRSLPPLGGMFLIATPYIGSGGWPAYDGPAFDDGTFSLPLALPVFFYHGTADETVPFAHLALFRTLVPEARFRELEGRDHQLGNDLTEVADDIRAV